MLKDFNSQAGMEALLGSAYSALRTKGANTINERFSGQLLSCSFDDMSCTVAFDMPEWMRNEFGAVHGGAAATAFDNAMGVLAWYMGGGRDEQTVSMQVLYMRAGKTGTRMIVKAHVTKRGRNAVFVSADAWNEGEEDVLTATATAVFHISSEGSGYYE